jgi:hypothetical protein
MAFRRGQMKFRRCYYRHLKTLSENRRSETSTKPSPRHAALLLPLALTIAFGALALFPSIHQNPGAQWAFFGAVAGLFAWTAMLSVSNRNLALSAVLKKQHYVQACAQLAVFVYWGWYWRQVYAFAPFILAQLLFAYAFDMLLSWSRRGLYSLGFGLFPAIFSINLFLWFKPEWFYLQFAMVALGLVAKEFLRWNRDGRRAHIFNPSSFPLALFSLALIATGSSGIAWGKEIASTQFYPPQMYLMLFLIGLPGQLLFGVASMTMSAVLTTYIFSAAYFAVTGIYFFYDSHIPIAVFLGMHLLFTDPSTSPRSEMGRIVYGVLYGLSTVGLYWLLGIAGQPTFYDKLLPVPLLNLAVKAIDGAVRRFDLGALGRTLTSRQRNFAYAAVWTAIFLALSTTEGLNDNHPGQWLPFWRRACQEGRPYACPYVADLEFNFCQQGSSWACNDAGLMDIALSRSGEDLRRLDPAQAAAPFRQGCTLGSAIACQNLRTLASGSGAFASQSPTLDDYPVILCGSKGPIREQATPALYALACREGWNLVCRNLP